MPDIPREVIVHKSVVARLRDEFPDLSEADLADTIEGESRLDVALAALLRDALEAEAMAGGIAELLLKPAKERKDRLEAKGVKLRAIALWALEEVGLRGFRAPDMTVSVRQLRQPLIITDETKLPDEFVKIERIPRKVDIYRALDEGREVPGTALGNASSFLSIRKG